MHPTFGRGHAVDDLADRVGNANPAERHVAARDAFGELHDVRLDAVVLQAEPSTRAAEPGDHLVGNQQHVVSRADLTDAREVVRRRDDDTSRPLHRFGDERRHRFRTRVEDGFLEFVGRGHAETDPRIRADEAIRVGRVDVQEARRARLEHRPEGREAGRAHRGEREPVIGALPRDDLDLLRLAERLPVEPRGLERRLGGFGPAAREEEGVDRGKDQRTQPLGQRDRGHVAPARIGGMKREGRHLPLGGIGQLPPAVSDVHVPQAREAVDVFASVRILDQRTVSGDPDARRGVRRRVMQRMKQMRPIRIERGRNTHARHATVLRADGHLYRSSPELTSIAK